MKQTLLELTQNVLSTIDGDDVNSISDTPESLQVVSIIKGVYADLVNRGELSVTKTLFNLSASGDNLKPVLMSKPESIDRIEWIKYNKIMDGDTDPTWSMINYLSVDTFMNHVHQFNPSETNIESMTYTTTPGFTLTFNYYNDRGPTYYTSFDDNTMIFDAYDAEVDTTLQSIKTLGFGSYIVPFTETDAFIPGLQSHQFGLLLNEAKAIASVELRQTPNPKAEQAARRNWVFLGKNRRNTTDAPQTRPIDFLPDFGRR